MFVQSNIRVSWRQFSYLPIASSILVLLALLVVPELLPSPSFADEPITVNPSITIGNSGVLSLDVNPGQFGSSTESVVVTTSNYTGYSMTIAPSSGNNTDLEHTNVANTVIPSISESLTQSSFSSLNSVAYGLSIDGGANYLPVVSGSTIKTTSTATNATTGSFNLTLGAKTLSSTPAGSYTKTFLLTATTNDAAYNITYDKNLGGDTDTTGNFPSTNEATVSGTVLTLSAKTPTRTGYEFLHWNTVDDDSGTSYNVQGTINLEPTTTNPITLYAIWQKLCPGICYNGNNDDGTGTMPDQTVSNLSSNQTLIGNNFSRSGYGFAGWSEDENAYTHLTDNDGTNDPTIYGPMETVTMPGHALNLYAVWVPAEKDGNDDPVYLQGWNGCSSLDPNEVIALTDSRDGSVYAIARIVDNTSNPTYSQCWMIENLRLDVTNSSITYTNSNTNHPASSFLYQKDAFTSGDPTWQTCTANSIACDDQISYSLANTNRTNTASYDENSTAGLTSSWYSYGGMYNWFTATAGNGLYGIGSNNTNSAGDLCPNGWRLPTGGSATATDYKSLNTAINSGSTSVSTGLRTYPTNLLYSGSHSGSSASIRGSAGNYWSSTSNVNNISYLLYFYGSYVYPGTTGSSKYNGQAVRCLAGNPNYYIIYDANGGTGYGDPQSLGTTAPDGTTTTTLTASNFSRTGYGFAGWSRNPNADPNGVNATTEIFGPNAEYTVPASTNFDSNKNLTLYAVWVPLAKDSNNNDLTFQTTNLLTTTLSDNSTLDSKSNGYVTALKDTRDNEVYAVAKLADGNYWMIENMRLDLSSNNTTITTSNTNHPTQAFVTDINTNYKGKANDPNTTLWKTCTDDTPACDDQTSFSINNLDRLSSSPIVTSPIYKNYGWRSYGIYYNWYTATGGHGTYNKTSSVADGDLCPFGWHLPYGGFGTNTRDGNTPGGFYYLNRMLNNGSNASDSVASSNLRRFPNNFALSGYSFGSSGGRVNENGYFWSNSANSDYNANNMELYVTGVRANYNYVKYSGQSIRCLANTTETFTLSYNANGGTGAPAADPGGSSNTNSYDFTLSSTEPTRSGLTFAGWATEQNATEESTLYQPGQTYTFYQPSTTLYAVWVPEVIIHFNGSGGTGSMADQGVPSGTSRSLRHNTFSKSGVNFAGWTTTEGSTDVEYLDQASYTAPIVTGPGPLEVTLYAVWGRSRSIMYNINTDDANANGTMGNQTGIYEYGQATLWAPNFARPNYGFAGWSTDSDAYTHMTDNDQTNDPTIYGPNETITVPGFGEGSSTLTLYAVWVPAESGVTMQTFNPNDSTYSSKPIGSVIALNDNRDTTNVYAVAKLKDSNWWMIENLRFDPAGKTLDNTNTNNPDSTFATTVSGLQSSSFATCQTNSSACDDQYSVGLGNLTSSNSGRTNSSQSYRWYSYGAMYNWYTATAGYGTYNKDLTNGAMPGDICPTGWHLPYGGSSGGNTSGGFYYLNYKLNNDSNATNATASNNLRAYPSNFLYSGFYYGYNTSSRGSYGIYWSSTANNNTNSYYLGLDNSSAFAGTSVERKYRGHAVRCVAYPRQTLTLSFDTTKVASIEIDGTSYNTNGATISLVEGSTHTINMAFQTGYEFDSWSVSGTGSSVASTSTNPTTLTMGTANSTLTASGKALTMLDTGSNVNVKLKSLAGDTSASTSTQNTTITAFQRSNTLPNGFTPSASNTISAATSDIPIYAWFDNGAINYYSEANTIYLNPNSSSMFRDMRNLSNGSGLSSLDASKVTNMSYMFDSAGENASTFSLDLSGWDTSSVTDMCSMFLFAGWSATTWSIGDLSGWDTSSVTNMSSMFSSAGRSATTWDIGNLSSWNTSSVTDMSRMFSSAGFKATTWNIGNLSSWNTSSVTNMSNMFSDAGYSATTWNIGNLSSWDTSSVTNMSDMFFYAGYSAKTFSLDLSSWNTSKVTNMGSMFSAAGYNAATWGIGNLNSWNTSSVTNMSNVFWNAGRSATTWGIGNLNSWNTSSVTNMGGMFYYAGYNASTFSLDLSSWNTSSVTNMEYMFSYAGRTASTFSLDLSSWNTSSVTYMSNMFYSAGLSASTWSITIPSTNGGGISNTASNLYGETTSVSATPDSGKSFTLAP